VRAFVLDGAIDPTLPTEEVNRQQAIGFEQALRAFLADCAANAKCPFNAGGKSAAEFDTLSHRIDGTPLPTKGGRMLGPGEFFLGVLAPLYSRAEWPGLAAALAQAAAGQGDLLLALSDRYTQRDANGNYGPLLSAN